MKQNIPTMTQSPKDACVDSLTQILRRSQIQILHNFHHPPSKGSATTKHKYNPPRLNPPFTHLPVRKKSQSRMSQTREKRGGIYQCDWEEGSPSLCIRLWWRMQVVVGLTCNSAPCILGGRSHAWDSSIEHQKQSVILVRQSSLVVMIVPVLRSSISTIEKASHHLFSCLLKGGRFVKGRDVDRQDVAGVEEFGLVVTGQGTTWS